MSPRRYDNSRRRQAAESTRRRIVEATLEVHGEQGIAGARLDDIAKRAGVSVGTLYRHFPNYEGLVNACGALTFERIPPPTAAETGEALAGSPPGPQATRRLVDRIFDFYAATGPMVEGMRRDSVALPFLTPWVEELDAGVEAWVQAALGDRPPAVRRVARALVDHRTWTALTEQGVEDVRGVVAALIEAASVPGGSPRA